NDFGSVTTQVRARQADLGVDLSGSVSGVEGELVSYTLVVTNYGPEASVHFVAGAWNVASGWSDVVASVGGVACSVPIAVSYLCSVDGLAVGGSVTISLQGRYLGSGSAVFNARVYNDPDFADWIQPVPADPNTANDFGSVTTEMRA